MRLEVYCYEKNTWIKNENNLLVSFLIALSTALVSYADHTSVGDQLEEFQRCQSYDWSNHFASPVCDQKETKACASIAMTGLAEAAYFQLTGKTVDLSERDLHTKLLMNTSKDRFLDNAPNPNQRKLEESLLLENPSGQQITVIPLSRGPTLQKETFCNFIH